MRLIDADALMEEVNIEISKYMLTEKGICSLIRNAPTIDAVEVVRCIDCRWYRLFDKCFFSTAELCPDDFCSYGEREGE